MKRSLCSSGLSGLDFFGIGPSYELFIGEALAGDTTNQRVRAIGIAEAERNAVIVAEVELGKVAMQMLLTALLVDAAHAALEDGEHALDGVGGDGAILRVNILLDAVQGGAVERGLLAELAVPRSTGNERTLAAVSVAKRVSSREEACHRGRVSYFRLIATSWNRLLA